MSTLPIEHADYVDSRIHPDQLMEKVGIDMETERFIYRCGKCQAIFKYQIVTGDELFICNGVHQRVESIRRDSLLDGALGYFRSDCRDHRLKI